MARLSTLLLTALLAVRACVPLAADELKDNEASLKSLYEGRPVEVQTPFDLANLELQVPRKDSEDLRNGVRVYLLIEHLEVRKAKIELKARRLHYYEDLSKQLRAVLGQKREYGLSWHGPPPTVKQIRYALNESFPPADDRVKEQAANWLPDLPEKREEEPASDRPSQELAPGIFTPGKDVTAPKCVSCRDPEYPEAARSARTEGTVELLILISDTGRIDAIRVLKSVSQTLDASAVLGVYDWRFVPAMRNGLPIRVVIRAEIRFFLY